MSVKLKTENGWVTVAGNTSANTSYNFEKLYENNSLAVNTPVSIENLNKYDFIVIQIAIGRASTIVVPNNGASTNYNISHYDGSNYHGYHYYNVDFPNNTITCTERNVVPSGWLNSMVVVYGCKAVSISGGSVDASNITYDNLISGAESTNIQDALDEVFQSVSNGKTLVASAITDKGIPTLATDSFATMAENISNIQSGGGDINVLYNALEVPANVSYLQSSYTPEKDARVIVIYHVNVGSNDVGTTNITGLDDKVVLASRGNTQSQGQYWVWLGNIKTGQTLTCKWSLNTGSYRRSCMTVIEV